jgi:uncharacterized membrane protein
MTSGILTYLITSAVIVVSLTTLLLFVKNNFYKTTTHKAISFFLVMWSKIVGGICLKIYYTPVQI